MKAQLTILTEEVSVLKPIKKLFIKILGLFHNPDPLKVISYEIGQIFLRLTQLNQIKISNSGGHSSVTRSLLSGLKKLGIHFTFNPLFKYQLSECVITLADINALKQCIKWKRKNWIQRLFVGPNMADIVNVSWWTIIASPEVEAYFSPSNWNRNLCLDFYPFLKDSIKIWYAGVDEEFWTPSRMKSNGGDVVVYWKNSPQELGCNVESKLKDYGWNPIRVQYGNYNPLQFKKILTHCQFGIVLSKSESQGIALAEMWAMNVPTLVWNPREPLIVKGQQVSNVSSCPYLTNSTGAEWKTIADLESILKTITLRLPEFHPRYWVLKNMTDVQSTKRILAIIFGMKKQKNEVRYKE